MASAKTRRNPEETRQHILEVGFKEIYCRGFQGISVDHIVSKTKLTKGAFYHHFPTKLDLGYAVVDEMLKEMIMERWIRPLSAYSNPVQGILARFKKNIVDWPKENLSLGCPLNNLCQEMSSVDKTFNKKLKAIMELWINETDKQLKIAQNNGYLKKTVKTKQLARFIVTIQEGAYGMAKCLQDHKALDASYQCLKNLLEAKKF